MGGRSASLLTKKQRDRIREGFDEMSEEKIRRDQQRIRDRLRSGLLDFHVLADYPDRQLELAFGDVSEEELGAALADGRLVLERVGELRGVDPDDVTARARRRADRVAEESADCASLDGLDLRTRAEIRREAEEALREEFEPNRWDRRADALLKLATGAAAPVLAVAVAEWVTTRALLSGSAATVAALYLSLLVLFAALSGVFCIKAAQGLKYNVIPAGRSLRRDPTAVARSALALIRRPGQTLQTVWEEL
ncbi:hypothetical protein ACFQMA_11605 [Halosimplex aquaticum]|uniref:Uncharacterized protein n=1 Tax=Halosimplex aquaticum TaxID=3026162 RepID=A0ABD5XZA3_9EURY|nr:hypothetical protein [Halosimplex aquaticum]